MIFSRRKPEPVKAEAVLTAKDLNFIRADLEQQIKRHGAKHPVMAIQACGGMLTIDSLLGTIGAISDEEDTRRTKAVAEATQKALDAWSNSILSKEGVEVHAEARPEPL